jgi:uncharacterized protein
VKRIDFETHFVTEEWIEAYLSSSGYPRLAKDEASGNLRLYYQADAAEPWGEANSKKLLDLGEGRIAEMDAAQVDVAVLSLTAPGVEQLEVGLGTRLAQSTNDRLAEAIDRFPDRFTGYAALAVKDADGAVQELERAVKDLGLKGWKTHSNFGDSYLDEKRYWPILAKAEQLGVPMYLHPTVPMIAALRTYGITLAGAAFGFGQETAMVMMRLVASGALDAFPDLKIIVGHYGEALPFLVQRMDFPYVHAYHQADQGSTVQLKRKPSDYLKSNMWVSTSGNYLPAAFACTRDALGMERIVLGTDHPYESMVDCMSFLESLALSPDDKAKLYWQNAASLGMEGESMGGNG